MIPQVFQALHFSNIYLTSYGDANTIRCIGRQLIYAHIDHRTL